MGQTWGAPLYPKMDCIHSKNQVGGLEPFFPYIGNVIVPTDEFIFFRGVGLNHQPVF